MKALFVGFCDRLSNWAAHPVDAFFLSALIGCFGAIISTVCTGGVFATASVIVGAVTASILFLTYLVIRRQGWLEEDVPLFFGAAAPRRVSVTCFVELLLASQCVAGRTAIGLEDLHRQAMGLLDLKDEDGQPLIEIAGDHFSRHQVNLIMEAMVSHRLLDRIGDLYELTASGRASVLQAARAAFDLDPYATAIIADALQMRKQDLNQA